MYRNSVLNKLATYGVPKFIIKWTSSFLINRQQSQDCRCFVRLADTARWNSSRVLAWILDLSYIIIDDLHSQLLINMFITLWFLKF